ncbi:MAG: DUF1800 family protein [Holophagaceae bacterium]|nr:DUF1800 family protein [Holophagaceae bacterium]
MATFDAQQGSWAAPDVMHFARRAGFGVTPEAAATLAAQPIGATIDAWIDQNADMAAFNAALPKADVINDPVRGAIPADPAPHPFRLEGWRRQSGIPNAQSHFAWRMQFNPNPLQEKLALFFHQLFATGAEKVDNTAFTVKQIDLFRAMGTAKFGDLLLAVSKDPAMMIWLDTVLNRVRPGSIDIPNENYAREILELYSLGVDNGYNQQDITNLAKALSGWTYTPLDLQPDPNNPQLLRPNDAAFRVNTNVHATGSVAFLGTTFDIGAPSNFGDACVAAILTQRGTNCAAFLAKRLLTFFVNPNASSAALSDLQSLILAQDFDLKAILKLLFKSAYFFDAGNRYNLYEGPVAWTVRMSRMLCPGLAAAVVPTLPSFPAWRAVVPFFENAGQAVLDPAGPNGWAEHAGWINSNTARYRGKLAASLALGEILFGSQMIFPSTVASWFPAAPASPQAVYDRLAALLQPAPVPAPVQANWLNGLWTSGFTWDSSAATQAKVRELAFLILCSPHAQLH